MPATSQTPRELARAAADEFFDAVAGDLPSGEVDPNLIERLNQIEDAISAGLDRNRDSHMQEDVIRQAAYMLGVEIGRRMGGAR
jgi:hypothetical protein